MNYQIITTFGCEPIYITGFNNNEEKMICKLEIKNENGNPFLGANFGLSTKFLEDGKENDLARLLTILLNERMDESFHWHLKNSTINVECWKYLLIGDRYENKLIKKLKLKINTHKFNLGVLEFIIDK